MSVVRTTYAINIAGQDVTSIFSPILIDLSVSDKVGTHSDSASITVDDTYNRVRMPRTGDPVTIQLGSSGTGMATVFEGTVDESTAEVSRSGGRTVKVTCKGVDTTKRAKEPQQRHFDDDTVQGILDKAAADADIESVTIKDGLGGIKRTYLEMRDESFLHLGERLAREVGGNFKISGNKATMTKRNAGSEGTVTAAYGVNLHSSSISPKLGRARFSKTKSRWYDKDEAEWKEVEKATDIKDATATFVNRYVSPDEDEAGQRSDSDKATSERDKGDGQVVIELNTAAKPDGTCVVVTGKPGVDGAYLIDTVTHSVSRGGSSTTLSLKRPPE